MKRFRAFIKKEFRHIFRDSRTLIILFGIPIAQLLIFGFVVTNEIKNVRIAVLDPSHDVVTRQITDKILSSGFFMLESQISHPSQIEEAFRTGKVREVIVFEPGFSQKLEKQGKAVVQVITDASDANTANLIANYTQAIITDYTFKRNQLHNSQLQIIPQTRMIYNESLKGVYMFIPGTMALILLLLSAMMTSISIAREKEFGTMEVLLVSPLNPLQVILGKVTPYFALSLINALTIITLGIFVFGMPVKGSLILLISECMLFILMSLSLGILISIFSKNQQMAMFISMFALMLPAMLLSGFIFPIENMPWPLQWLASLLPPKYFVTIVKNIMLKGTGFFYVWKETLVIAAMTIGFIGLSVKKYKIRLE